MSSIIPKKVLTAIIFFALSTVILTQDAEAYLNPGAGSYVIQYIIALLIGAFYFVKIYWKQIKKWIVNLFQKKVHHD